MDVFVIPVADRALVRPYQYEFQTHVAHLANINMGLRNAPLLPAAHHKGGVVVAGKSIVIDDSHVFDLANAGPTNPTPEEAATTKALLTCVETFKILTTRGTPPEQVFMPAPPTMIMGDRLKQFFRHVP